MIFYEAPHKLLSTLEDFLDTLGDRRICLVRELTKLHEEVFRTTLSQAVAHYRETPPRGEFVLILDGAPKVEEVPLSVEDAVEMARERMRAEGLSASMAAKAVAAETGLKKGDIYKALTED